jgi:ribosomal protein S27E
MFLKTICPNCGNEGTAFITRTAERKIVFDACNKCGTKTTKEEEGELETIKTEE